MKVRSLSCRLSQSVTSLVRSISSAVQKDASAFLYIFQMSSCAMGKRTKWLGLSCRSGSRGRSALGSAMDVGDCSGEDVLVLKVSQL